MRYRNAWNFMVFLIAMMLMMLSAPLWATKPHKPPPGAVSSSSSESSVHVGGTNVEVTGPDISVPVAVGDTVVNDGDTVVSGDKNRAYALGMASGTIADCMAHMAVAIVSIPTRNKFCQKIDFAQWAERPNTHTAASIKIRCSTWVAKDVFGGAGACESAFKAKPRPDPYSGEIKRLSADNSLLARRIDTLEARLEASESALREKTRKATLEARYAVREAQNGHDDLPEELIEDIEDWVEETSEYLEGQK